MQRGRHEDSGELTGQLGLNGCDAEQPRETRTNRRGRSRCDGMYDGMYGDENRQDYRASGDRRPVLESVGRTQGRLAWRPLWDADAMHSESGRGPLCDTVW
jgi:hypothetical protein